MKQETAGRLARTANLWYDQGFWLVMGLAVALRVGLLAWAAAHGVELAGHPDTPTYTNPAASLLAAGTFSQNEQPPYHIDTLRTPGYPLLVAAIWGLGQTRSAVPVAIVQVLLSVAGVGLVYAAARRFGGRRAALAAGLLLALETMSAALPSYVLSDALYQCAVAAWVLLLVRYVEARTWGRLAAAAAMAGLALYVRPVGLLFPAVLAVAALAGRPVHDAGDAGARAPLRRRLAQAVMALVIPAVLVLPWCLRNHLGADTWEMTTIASENMLRYRAAKVMSLAEGKDFYHEAPADLAREAASRTPPDATPGERLEVKRQVAIEYMMRHPGLTLRAYAEGLAVLLALPDRWTLPHLLGVDEKGGTLHSGAGWWDKIRRLREQYHDLTIGYMIWTGLYLLAIWVLAVKGFVRLWRRREQWVALSLTLVLLSLTVASAVPESEPHLRLPLMVPLILLAGAAIRPSPRERG